jgi:hypothetical protein
MRTQRYYTIRTIVRYAFWVPLTAWVCLSMLEAWARLI